MSYFWASYWTWVFGWTLSIVVYSSNTYVSVICSYFRCQVNKTLLYWTAGGAARVEFTWQQTVGKSVSQCILVQILVLSWTLLPFCLEDTVKLLFQPMPHSPRDFRKSIAFWKVPRLRLFVSLVTATCRCRWALTLRRLMSYIYIYYIYIYMTLVA